MNKKTNVIFSSTNETTIQEVIHELIKVHTDGAWKYSKTSNDRTTKNCH